MSPASCAKNHALGNIDLDNVNIFNYAEKLYS